MDRCRRRAARVSFSGWVEITANGRRQLGNGWDLSSQGIGVRLNGTTPPPACPVTSEFALPGISLPLAMEGRVVWCDVDEGRFGVHFESTDPGVAELLERFVAGTL